MRDHPSILGDADPGWDRCSPFAPDEDAIRFDPVWRTSTVVSLTAGIVQDDNFDVMPILADSLQDAGCDNTILLDHCRHGVNHTKDCWSLQLVLSPNPPAVEPPQLVATSRPILAEATQIVEDMGDRERAWFLFPAMTLSFATVMFLDSTSPRFHALLGRDENYIAFLGLFMTFTIAPCLLTLFLGCCVKAMWNRRRRRRARR